jgi:hypothetical protein
MSIRCLRWVCLPGAPLRRSDVLTTPGWMVPTRSKTVDFLPRQRFRRRKSFIDLSATARFGQSISTTSVSIELDQPLVADPEVMRDLMEHDLPDLAA